MLKLIYATTNTAKIEYMNQALLGMDLNIVPLDQGVKRDTHVVEEGETPLENARIKALAYYEKVNQPLFSADSGLYFENVADEDQPGVNVRRVKGRELTDEEMIDYYTELAKKYGGELIARYRNAVCLIHEGKLFEVDGVEIASPPFIISAIPHSKRQEGFPLDSLSIDIKTKEYYMDKENGWHEKDDRECNGLRKFFEGVIKNI